ncbi:hypothetical protein C8R21_1288 [Nitrosospira multiformis]|uniref:Uncharacterized protein n=1 Tax=Nitrosospira multiformis TaxID=1231 RepID=A0A2T5I6G3_9PROT|nr:hypothetical protein [Nitrosospira multiformis]PTQ79399.1 hypothetical protein C8R21_1288 [Nitrosospira multiformis]
MASANIYYDNTSLERLLEKSRQDFPIAGVAIKLERDSSETRADSAHEVIRIVLDPQQLASLLGIAKVGCASGIAEVERKPAELITEDLYEWIRRFLKRLAEDFIKDPLRVRYGKGIRGIHLAITSGNDTELKCGFHLVYSDNNKRFSYDRLSACLDIFPIIIRPIIRSLAETAKVRAVTIQGCPGFDNPASWLFSIETGENLYSFPEIFLENVIDSDTARKTVSDWTRRSNEIKKTPLRTMRAFDRN